jgi:hypothetical protein
MELLVSESILIFSRKRLVGVIPWISVEIPFQQWRKHIDSKTFKL